MFGDNTLKIENLTFDFQGVVMELHTLAKPSSPSFDTARDAITH
jgi:hypothetical protein